MSLSEIWYAARQAAEAGQLSRFRAGYADAFQLLAAVRADARSFASQWQDVLDVLFDAGEVGEGMRTLGRAADAGLVSPATLPQWDSMRTLLDDCPQAFDAGQALVRDAVEGRSLLVGADVLIVGWQRLNNPASRVPAYAQRAWLTTAATALRISQKHGRSAALVPDYLGPHVECTSAQPRRLSFHTTGHAEGLVHFKPADLPDYVVFDPGGYSGWSSMAGRSLQSLDLASAQVADRFFEQHRREVLNGNVSKYAQKPSGDVQPLPPRYVFVAMQVATDRTQALAYLSMLEMLDIVVSRFAGSDTQVVVKRHPLCHSDVVAARLTELAAAGRILLRDDSIHPLIAGSQAVIVVNSGVGSEAVVHLKPIYVFGAADYDCIAHKVHSGEEFQRLTTPIRPTVPLASYRQFLHYYRTRYLVDLRDPTRVDDAVTQFLAGAGKTPGFRGRNGLPAWPRSLEQPTARTEGGSITIG